MSEETEVLESMKDFEQEINNSFHRINEDDILKGTIVGISDTMVNVDLGSYAQGVILPQEWSNNPQFLVFEDLHVGDAISALVLREDDGQGNVLLSLKKANDVLAWGVLKAGMENKTKYSVKLSNTVNGGIITYLEGIRGFIPASQLSLSFVEDLEEWVGRTIQAVIITLEEDKSRLVLSGKEVEREKALEDRNSKISLLQKGLVTTGVIEKIMPYGCFINMGEGLSGLVHISQICGKHIQSPNEVVKLGQEVNVKILDVKDGKVSLSMKAVDEREEVLEEVGEALVSYSSGEEAGTGLAALLAGIELN